MIYQSSPTRIPTYLLTPAHWFSLSIHILPPRDSEFIFVTVGFLLVLFLENDLLSRIRSNDFDSCVTCGFTFTY